MGATTSWGIAGALIADRYRLHEPIVKGAMGTIWRAEHVQLKSPVAVKLLDPILARDQEMQKEYATGRGDWSTRLMVNTSETDPCASASPVVDAEQLSDEQLSATKGGSFFSSGLQLLLQEAASVAARAMQAASSISRRWAAAQGNISKNIR